MGYSISAVHVKFWESAIRQLAQQTDTRLRGRVEERSGAAASRSWSRIASGDWTTKGARGTNTAVATVLTDSQYSGRVASVVVKESGDLIEQDEIEQVAIDPKAAVLGRLAAGGNRAIDSLIIAAATGNAPDDAGGANAFDSTMIVGDYSTEFDYKMFTDVNRLFMAKNVDPNEPKVLVIGPNQYEAMLHDARFTSGWYVDQKPLPQKTGQGVRNFMGFDIIVSNLLSVPATNQLQCLAFTKRAIGLSVAKDIWVRVAESPTESFAWRIYSSFTMGAVRVEDEQVVQLQVKDTFTARA